MKPFIPHSLPLTTINWIAFIEKMSEANRKIARYDGLLRSIVQPNVLLAPLQTKESVLSSTIEGTQASLREVLEYEAHENEKPANDDIAEILNYRRALTYAKERLQEKPISLGVIKEIHKILMQDVRGRFQSPGNFRNDQNWIGKPGTTIESARFIPPSVKEMNKSLDEWEKYIYHLEKDPIIQLAIIHGQFEIIHPFRDGNGRIGRILIPLFLYQKGIIYTPSFFMSEYLESHRNEYYDSLKSISDLNDWSQWLHFFLDAFISQADSNIKLTSAILDLYDKYKIDIIEYTHSQYALPCLDFLFSRPIFSSSSFKKESGIPHTSTNRLLRKLEDVGIINCIAKGAGSKPSYFIFNELYWLIN